MPAYYERKAAREAKALEIVEFAPVVRQPMKPQTKIHMICSVHGLFANGYHYELVAGKDYWVDQEKADEFIIKGYATGNLSRSYTDGEVDAIKSTIQVINTAPGGIVNG